jgi:hypothetical protein
MSVADLVGKCSTSAQGIPAPALRIWQSRLAAGAVKLNKIGPSSNPIMTVSGRHFIKFVGSNTATVSRAGGSKLRSLKIGCGDGISSSWRWVSAGHDRQYNAANQ